MATPVVAGVAALLRQKYPAYSTDQIKNRLKSTALDLGNDLWTQGAGRVQVQLRQAQAAFLEIDPAGQGVGQ